MHLVLRAVYLAVAGTVSIALQPTQAQTVYQLPDPSFEDWSGAPFDNKEQPRYWNYSNVSQLGIASFNFAQKETGRTGGFAMKVQDQSLKVAGIGETSPGYIALGQPWAHVSSIGAINKATAGTYGGISWTTRPDTMTVWIKRSGPRTADENYNILFYSWRGTSEGGSFKGKDESCSIVPDTYRYDEESDIRLALDANECQTITPGQQVAEGWIYERTSYADWTLIKIPILYLNDLVPEKCNVIFSASNYPNFRANTGLYAGNTLIVDDVNLIYSSKIQKLYIGGKEWKGFDPNNTTSIQTYSLGQGATTIPQIEARRGAGTLINNRKQSATFAGRVLSGSEIQIVNGTVDGAPTVITVTSEDGSSTSTYQIQFVSQQSNNPRLASISINGEALSNFNPYLATYNVKLPYGTTSAPVVSVEQQEDAQTVQITQATSTSGTATIVVTAADGVSTQTYTIHFSVALLSDNTLQDIKVNGVSTPGFVSTKTTYTVELPLGTTEAPTITPVSAYPNGEQTITIVSNTLDAVAGTGQCKISVSAPGAVSPRTYTLNYRVTASTYSYLSDLMLDGETIDGFEADNLTYYVYLPMGTTTLPAITWTAGDPYQTITPDASAMDGLDGTYKVQVVAASGAQSIYRINFTLEKSDNNQLSAIFIGGEALPGFDPAQTAYTCELPIGTTTLPEVTWTAGDEYQTISKLDGGVNGTTRITVKAGDGTTRVYTIAFSVAKASDATLNMIYLNGEPLEGFSSSQLEYSVILPQGTTTLPVITYDQHDEYQTVTVRSGGVNGDYRITVKPQSGAAQTYTIHFSVTISTNTALSMIYLDGVAIENFDPAVYEYTDTIEAGVTTLPVVTYDKAEAIQRVIPEQAGNVCRLVVTAESGATATYVIQFVQLKSANAFLQMIYLDGDSLKDFEPETLQYLVVVDDEADVPAITVEKNIGQQVMIAQPTGYGVAHIIVTPEEGSANVYQLTFCSPADTITPIDPVHSDNTTLQDIRLNGISISDYDPQVRNYEIALGADDAYPTILYTKAEETQSVIAGQSMSQVMVLTVIAENGSTGEYNIVFNRALHSDAALASLTLDGVSVEGFAPDTYEYNVALPVGSKQHKAIAATPRSPYASMTVSENDTMQIVDVYAEDGTHLIYNIHYDITLSTNAKLSNLLMDGVALSDFDAETYSYTVHLPWHATALPELTPVAADSTISEYSIQYADLNEVTKVVVLAQDSLTTATYEVLFSVAQSSNAVPDAIDIDGAIDYTFSAATHDYHITLPYGTTAVPEIFVTKGEQEQQIVMITRSLCDTSEVIITAEDGTESTYTYTFEVQPSSAANVLTQIVHSTGVIDLTANPAQTEYTIPLPYDATEWSVESYIKNFPEQSVVIAGGEALKPTVITVYSNRAGEEPRTYTITPKLAEYAPTAILALTVDGADVPGFSPARHSYVVSVADEPTVVATLNSTDAELTETQNTKHWQGIVSTSDGKSETYDLWFYYPGDITFSCDFEDWASVSNTLADLDEGTPVGWHNPIDATTTGDKGSYDPKSSFSASDDATSGSRSASLKTAYLLTSAEAMPGILSLSPQSVSIGAYYIIGHTASTISFGEPITFRNSPDSVALDYKTISNNKVNAWHWIWKANNQTNFDYTGNYNTKNEWLTISQRIEYAADFVPTTLDIHINPAQSESLNDYYVGTSGAQTRNRFTSSMLVDNMRMYYNSRIASLSVNGIEANRIGNAFSIELADAEIAGLPKVTVVGEVADQAAEIVWSDEVAGVRTAAIRNYAEDLSYTDYTLTITRPLSAEDSVEYELTDDDLSIRPLSMHQTYTVDAQEAAYLIQVTAENGTNRTFTLPRSIGCTPVEKKDTTFAVPFGAHVDSVKVKESFVPTPATTTDLLGIMINGAPLADFNPLNANYEVFSDSALAIEALTTAGQRVAISLNEHTYTILVTAEDGIHTATYSVTQEPAPISLHSADLAGITVNGTALTGFTPAEHEYEMMVDVEYPAVIAQMPDVAYVAADSLQQVETAIMLVENNHVVTFSVFAADGVATAQYTIRFISHQINVPEPVEPSHNALLSNILLDGTALSEFAPTELTYSITLPMGQKHLPDVSYILGDSKQTTTIERNGTTWEQTVTIGVTAEDGTTYADYVLTFVLVPSNIATLQMISADGAPLADFDAAQYTYQYSLEPGTTILPVITYTKADDAQTVVLTTDTTSLAPLTQVNTLTVTAEDGTTTHTYSVTFVVPFSTVDTLQMIYADGEALSNFRADTLTYTYHLPVGTRTFPVLTYDKGYAQQTVVTDTLLHTDWAETIALIVTAEDGTTTRTYTIQYDILRSTTSTLSMIYVSNEPLPDFDPATTTYTITLPVGTTQLPEVAWTPADEYEVITTDTMLISNHHGELHITAMAEDSTSTTYTLLFEVALSEVSTLDAIYVGGTALAEFDQEIYTYSIQLPRGTTEIPVVAFDKSEETETVAIDTIAPNGKALPSIRLTVTAEDGVHQSEYFVQFTIEPSHNADLEMIFLNGDSLAGFDPNIDAYTITLPYGQWTLPVITWTAGDEEQTIVKTETDTDKEKSAVLTVTAGDQLMMNIYTLIFTEEKSTNAHLSDLRLHGTTIEGFHRDSMQYVHRVKEVDLAKTTDITATPEDKDATVLVSELDNHTLTVLVTAADGLTTCMYIIEQPLILSANNRLSMIYLDGVELRGFNPDTLHYTYLLPMGTLNAPEVTAEAEDEKAVIEYSAVVVEDTTRIYCTAEDGSTQIYTIYFHQSNINPGLEATIKDVYFMHVHGTATYRAISLRAGVEVAVYDMAGHRVMMESVPAVDPNDVVTDKDENGNEYIVSVSQSANGAEFEAQPGIPYFYVFWHSTDNSRLAKGGKFMLSTK